MLILAIDTALEICAAAVLDTDAAQIVASESLVMKRGHAEALMPLIERVMKAAQTRYDALDRIAVTTGPGSFTGLRVGISAARGLALAADKPVIGVTTLSAYAAPHVSETGTEPILTAIDARHDHVYFQAVRGDGAMLLAPRIAPVAEALECARFGAPRLVGNDAVTMLAKSWPPDAAPPVLIESRQGPDIGWVGWLGAAATLGQSPARPFYLKAPDARPQEISQANSHNNAKNNPQDEPPQAAPHP